MVDKKAGIIIDAVVANNLVSVVKDNVKNSRVFVSTDGKVQSFVNGVVQALGNADAGQQKISALRIWSHGWTHYADGGEYPDGNVDFGEDGRPGEDLRLETFEKFKPTLNLLKPLFDIGGRAELRGCAIAKGTGMSLMVELANLWQVRIYASAVAQSLVNLWGGQVWVATPSAGKPAPGAGIEVYEGR